MKKSEKCLPDIPKGGGVYPTAQYVSRAAFLPLLRGLARRCYPSADMPAGQRGSGAHVLPAEINSIQPLQGWGLPVSAFYSHSTPLGLNVPLRLSSPTEGKCPKDDGVRKESEKLNNRKKMKYKHSGFKLKSSGFSPALIRLGLLYALLFIVLLFSQSRWLLGDVNNDGSVDVMDIVRTVNIILGLDPPPESQELIMADVNDDGDVNIMDIIVTLNYILDTLCTEDNASPCAMNYTQCCPDTTGNNFVWDIQVFGNESGSINSLYDAFIIDENDIWAVGEIREFDGDTLHNYLHWDGEEWTRGIMMPVNTQNYWPYYLRSVYGFSQNDVWVAITVASHFDGNEWHEFNLEEEGFPHNLGATKYLWGTSSENMYFGEHSGDIIHWDGETFTIMETTTGSGSQYNPQYPIQDLYGIDENHIWTLGRDYNMLSDEYPQILMFYDGSQWNDLYIITTPVQQEDQLSGWFYGLWAYGDTLYVSASQHGLWRESITTGEGSYFPLDSLEYENAGWSRGKGLAGNQYNDIFTVSEIAKYAHYNGSGWYFGNEVYDYFLNLGLYQLCAGMEVKGDTIILFGDINLGERVWVARGVRME